MLALLATVHNPAAFAQTNSPGPAPVANRYLLVVETSSAMSPRTDGLLDLLDRVVDSGLRGEMRAGDTIGLWTFTDQLVTGKFPLQRWTRDTRTGIASRVQTFIVEQKFARRADLGKVVPAINDVVAGSANVTVLLVSTGEDTLKGTPFDEPINEQWRSWRAEQRRQRMPVLTVLRGHKGVIADYKVTPAPWPLELPPLPLELRPAPVVAAPVKPADPPPNPVGAPLIVSGRKPGTNLPAGNLSQPQAPLNPTPADANPAPTAPGTAPRTAPPDTARAEPAPAGGESTSAPAPAVSPPKDASLHQPPAAPEAAPGPKPSGTVVPQPVPESPDAGPAPKPAVAVSPPTAPDNPAPAVAVAPRVRTRSPLIWVTGAALVIALVVAGALWLRRPQPPRSSAITQSIEGKNDSEP